MPGNFMLNPIGTVSKNIDKIQNLAWKVSDDKINLAADVFKIFKKALLEEIFKEGSGTTITNNEIEDIIKLIRSLENRGVIIKGSTRKITTQEGVFLNFLKTLMSVGLPLVKNVLTPLAKNVLVPSELTAADSATDAAIQKKIYGSGTTTLVFSNAGLNNNLKIAKSLEESSLLIKGVTETVEYEVKEQKGGLFSMFAGTLGVTLLGNVLSRRGIARGGDRIIRSSEGFLRAGEGQDF